MTNKKVLKIVFSTLKPISKKLTIAYNINFPLVFTSDGNVTMPIFFLIPMSIPTNFFDSTLLHFSLHLALTEANLFAFMAGVKQVFLTPHLLLVVQ